jgi:hypothetical protein
VVPFASGRESISSTWICLDSGALFRYLSSPSTLNSRFSERRGSTLCPESGSHSGNGRRTEKKSLAPIPSASPPGDASRLALSHNRVQHGPSDFLCDMKKGEKVSLEGPFGDFILRPPIGDTIFIATGTGIAPFRAMRQWLFADGPRHRQNQLWLLFGNRIRNRHL